MKNYIFFITFLFLPFSFKLYSSQTPSVEGLSKQELEKTYLKTLPKELLLELKGFLAAASLPIRQRLLIENSTSGPVLIRYRRGGVGNLERVIYQRDTIWMNDPESITEFQLEPYESSWSLAKFAGGYIKIPEYAANIGAALQKGKALKNSDLKMVVSLPPGTFTEEAKFSSYNVNVQPFVSPLRAVGSLFESLCLDDNFLSVFGFGGRFLFLKGTLVPEYFLGLPQNSSVASIKAACNDIISAYKEFMQSSPFKGVITKEEGVEILQLLEFFEGLCKAVQSKMDIKTYFKQNPIAGLEYMAEREPLLGFGIFLKYCRNSICAIVDRIEKSKKKGI